MRVHSALAVASLSAPAFSLLAGMPGVYFAAGDGGGASGSGGGMGGNENGGDTGGSGNQPATLTPEQIAALNNELAALKAERDDLSGEVKANEDKGKADADKTAESLKAAQDAASAAETRIRLMNLQIAVEWAARKLNVVDEDAAFRLLDRDAVKFDKDGKPLNVDALLADLVKAKTWLVGASGGTGGSATNPARGRDGADKPKTLADAIGNHYKK